MSVRGVRARRLALKVLVATIGGVWIASMLNSIQRIESVFMGDYLTYVAGASRLLRAEPLYPAFQLDGPFLLGDAAWGVGYVYPPTSAVLSVPLGLVSSNIGFVVFTTVSAVALAAVVFWIARSEGLRRPLALGLSLLVVFSGPAIDSLSTGNVNSLAAVALGASWLTPRLSGYYAVIGAVVKLYPGLGILWGIRLRAPIVGPLLLGSAVVAFTLLWPGTEAWMDFLRTLSNGRSSGFVFIQPPRNVLEPVIGAAGATAIAYGVTGLLAIVAWRHRSDRLAFFALSVAMIIHRPRRANALKSGSSAPRGERVRWLDSFG